MNELIKIENNQVVLSEEAIEQLNKIKDFEILKAKMDVAQKEIKNCLKENMERLGIKKLVVKDVGLFVSIKDATTRTTIDTKRLKEECPDIYEAYSKTSPVSSSITLTFEE